MILKLCPVRHASLYRRSGFTLVELMIVVAIIGVLAAIAIPNFMGLQEKAKRRALQANVVSAKAELQSWLDATVKKEENVVDLDGNGIVGTTEGPVGSLVNVPSSWIVALIAKKGKTPLSPWYSKPLYTTIAGVYSGGIVLSRTANNMSIKIIGYALNGTTLIEEAASVE